MSKTYCIAEMKFIDVDALADASLSTSTGQSIEDLGLFSKEDKVDSNSYAGLDHNQFVLDGSKTIIPATPTDIAFWSNIKSSDDCAFTTNPVMTISFDDNHTSAGITLYFQDDYPSQLKITWYMLDGTKIIGKTFYPTSLIYTCIQQVTNYGKVEIEFIKTNLPQQYIKMQYILYGKYVKWSNEIIKNASVVEEIDLTSSTISINTATLEVLDENNDFDLSNDDGAWKSVQKNQPVTLTENVDGTDIAAGTYYIKNFSFTSNVAKFDLIDSVGVLDYFTFYDGEIYTDVTAQSLIDKIMAVAGITNYTIADDIATTTLSGYLAVQTCREALQIVCFACGAVVDDSRSDTIKIYKPDKKIKYVVNTDRKFNGGTTISQDDYVSGVSIECSKYALGDTAQDIYDDTLPAGDTKIVFDSAYDPTSITATAGTLKTVKTNYLIITMDAAGECTISGMPYNATQFTMTKSVSVLEAGEFENIKEFSGLTLYNADTVQTLLDDLLDYYTLRKKVSLKYLVNKEQSGDWINIKDRADNNNASLIESQTVDLTGGFIATATCRGYSLMSTSGYYAGNSELLAYSDLLGGALL